MQKNWGSPDILAGPVVFPATLGFRNNTDELILLYDMGAAETRLQIDNDDSDSWLLRVTDYTDGNAITIYNAVEDIPDQYQDYFDFAFV